MLFKGFEPSYVFEADKGGAGSSGDGGDGGSGGDGGQGGQGGSELAYETWVQEQPEEVQTMLVGWESGLKSALANERDARKKAERELRDLAGKAEKGSEAEQKLLSLADQMSEADRKADFYEAAHTAGVTNLKLAYLVAVQDDLFDRRGNVNFEQIKRDYPELFGGSKTAAGNAGSGTKNGQPAGKGDMNAWIRKTAGYETN